MTSRVFTGRRARFAAAAPRVGLCGLLGSGNLGNDGMLESVLAYLRADQPDAIVDFMCSGPERVQARYGVAAIPLNWYQKHEQQASGVLGIALRVLGKGIDAYRTASWVRRHDVVIVPGAGVLEATLPVRASSYPYTMFLLSASGRLFGTKVALVSVGANVISQRLTKWLFASAARLAFYRSYRDTLSRDAMRRAGVDTKHDHVYPDLAFALPAPPDGPGAALTVGVGVMAYYGGNDDRRHADEIHASYVEKMKCFVRWLADSGHRIRLFGGDNNFDDSVVQEILADLRAYRPDLEPMLALAEPVTSMAELMREIAPVGIVVATRYHNVLCALKLSKPTLSIGYAAKHDVLMADMGLSEFCQSARSLDVDRLIEQFKDLESRSAQLRRTMLERNAEKARLLDRQFAVLSALLFPAGEPACAAERRPLPGSQHTPSNKGLVMDGSVSGEGIAPGEGSGSAVRYYKRDFWIKENLKHVPPHYRLQKAARIVNRIAAGKECDLLDVGCGPATLMRLLQKNIHYYGIDIAIHDPAPNLIEADLLEAPIKFGDKRFDIILAQGVFEYVGDFQSQKFAEIAQLLNDGGTFILTYTNFGHHKKHIYEPFSNVQSLDDFRKSLTRYFNIDRSFPTSHNWYGGQPSRKLIKTANMHINMNIPVISPMLAVEYFFICSARSSRGSEARPN